MTLQRKELQNGFLLQRGYDDYFLKSRLHQLADLAGAARFICTTLLGLKLLGSEVS